MLPSHPWGLLCLICKEPVHLVLSCESWRMGRNTCCHQNHMAMDHPQEDLVICSKCPWFTKPIVILMRILSGAYPPICLPAFHKCSISHRWTLFASRLNHQVETFVSWKPEPEAWRLLMLFPQRGGILSFMLSLHLVSWVKFSQKSKKTKLPASWWCHCGLHGYHGYHGSLWCWIYW